MSSLFRDSFWRPPVGVEQAIRRGNARVKEWRDGIAPRAEPLQRRVLLEEQTLGPAIDGRSRR